MRDHRVRLFRRIILSERNKVNMFGIEQQTDILHVHSQGVICGKRDQKGFIIAQMRFCRHQYGGVSDPVRQFGDRISRTGE